MPETEVRIFRAANGSVPFWEWFVELSVREPKAYRKALARILRLSSLGHELVRNNRNEAAHLEDGIYELRWNWGRVNYRILYFFYGQGMICLSQGFTKERVIPPADIETAKNRKKLVQSNPALYTADLS
jgi:putative component of toxin-antitoxin plasmid stabilization module